MEKLILLFAVVLALSVTPALTQEKINVKASPICGPVEVPETGGFGVGVGSVVRKMAREEGCSEVHGREISPSRWLVYGVRLGNTSPAYNPTALTGICGPVTLFNDIILFDLVIQGLVDDGCTELHLLTVVPFRQWTAFGINFY